MSIRERADLLFEARWLLPIAPANTALAEHAVAVTAGRIVAVGPAAQLRERFETGERVVRERHALLPGLVNEIGRASCRERVEIAVVAVAAKRKGTGSGVPWAG